MITLPQTVLAQKSIALTEIFVVKENEKQADHYLQYMLPSSLENLQEIINVEYSIHPDTFYISKNGYTFAIWMAPQLNTGDSIIIKTDMVISRFDLETVMEKNLENEMPIQLYISPFDFTSDTIIRNKIKAVADSLNTGETVSTLKNIFEFVQERLEYNAHRKKSSHFDLAWNEGHGDCTEYAQLMATMAQAADIPIRMSKGKALLPKSTVAFHDWLEAYIPDLGWIPFDPTFADTGTDHTSFSTLQNMYAYYSFSKDHQYFYTYPGIDFEYYIYYTDKTEVLYAQCFKAYNAMKFEKAHLLLDSLLYLAKDHSGGHTLKGMLYARQNQFEKGKPYLERSINLAQSETEQRLAYYALANFYALEGKINLSLSSLEKSIALGLTNHNNLISEDIDLKSLYTHPKFIQMIKELESKK